MSCERFPDDHDPPAAPPLPGEGCRIISLHEHRLREFEAAVERTATKLDRLERKLIRGEVRKGKLRRKLLRRLREFDAYRHRNGAAGQAPALPERPR